MMIQVISFVKRDNFNGLALEPYANGWNCSISENKVPKWFFGSTIRNENELVFGV